MSLDAAQFASPLAGTGVRTAQSVHANLTAPLLVTHALRRGEGRLSSDGALIVKTGVHTGRSVQDKFVVDEPETAADVWWRPGNQRLSPAKFELFKGRVQAYLQGQPELFTQDLYAGADPAMTISFCTKDSAIAVEERTPSVSGSAWKLGACRMT